MNLLIHKDRFKIYLRIAVIYFLLSAFGEIFQEEGTYLQRVWNNAWLLCYVVFLNYYFYEFAVPKIRFTWEGIFTGPLLLFVVVILCSLGFYLWRVIGVGLHIYFPLKEYASISAAMSDLVPFSIFSIFFFGTARHIHDYRKLKTDAQQLRIEKQEAELNYLKSQTNPHFLFNTLNNIYSLARDKSDLAPESILRLSKILRFMLYEAGGEYIAVEQEIKIMTDYIALEKLRYDESLHVNFNHDVEDMKQSVPPLLLIPLVENAFKHGVSETRNRPFVDIHLAIKNRLLMFVVKNSAEALSGNHQIKESIGLSNLRRQLQLLYRDYDLSLSLKQ